MQWEVPMCFWFVQWVRKGVLIGFLLTQVSPLVVVGLLMKGGARRNDHFRGAATYIRRKEGPTKGTTPAAPNLLTNSSRIR